LQFKLRYLGLIASPTSLVLQQFLRD